MEKGDNESNEPCIFSEEKTQATLGKKYKDFLPNEPIKKKKIKKDLIL
jgi:hypothetical protein